MNPRKIIASLCLALATSVTAAPFTVTNTADTGAGSLRQAIADANAAAGADTISFDAALSGQTITLTSGQVLITDTLTIQGFADRSITISGNNASRIFRIETGSYNVTLTGLTVTNGFQPFSFSSTDGFGGGGAVLHRGTGTLTVTNCAFSNNSTGVRQDAAFDRGGGGAIYRLNPGNLVVSDSTFTGNSSGFGGAIYSGDGTAATTITNSTFSANIATLGFEQNAQGDRFVSGGAIHVSGTCNISGSSFLDNVARGNGASFGGAIYIDRPGSLALSNSTVLRNIAGLSVATVKRARGGAIFMSSGAATITNSTISNNSALGYEGAGGAINKQRFNESPALTITDSTIADNVVDSGSTSEGGIGGGIYHDGPLNMSGSSLLRNSVNVVDGGKAAGGGLFLRQDGVSTIANSTVANNVARSAAGGAQNTSPGRANGGGVFVQANNQVNITNCQITGNLAEGVDASGGGVYGDRLANQPTIGITGGAVSNNAVAVAQGTSGEAGFGRGGGIYTGFEVSLALSDAPVSGNAVRPLSTGGAASGVGGGIFNWGTNSSINRSSVSRNIVSTTGPEGYDPDGGGGLYQVGRNLIVTNSTFGNNSVANGNGGGIWVGGDTLVVTISNSTVAANAAGGTQAPAGLGGGIHNSTAAETTVKDSIIALNTAGRAGPDVQGAFLSGGYNLVGNTSGGTGFTGTGDQLGVDPVLAPLGNYGGATETFALLAGSPALNTGDPNFNPNTFVPPMTTDQRGAPYARVRNGRLDIGAYEAPPAPVITGPANGARTGPAPLITGTAEPGATVVLTITNGTNTVTGTTTADSQGNFSVNASGLGEGNHTVDGVQGYGNEVNVAPSRSNSRSFVVDATPPTITGVPANITVEATGPNGATVTYTQPTANDSVDGPVPVNCAPASGSTFALGTTLVTCSASDTVGNTSTANFTVTVRDTTAPTISNVPANITVDATGPDGAPVSYANPTATDTVSGNVPVNCSPASGSTFAVGTTTVTCTATDNAGNSASATFTVDVRDTTAPVITVPGDIVVYNEQGKDGATVTFNVTATDSASGAITPTVNPPSGSVFPIGTTVVTVTARDAAGNTSTKTFEVTVRKTELANIATRVPVGTGEKVGIGGFIIRGTDPLRVIVRARGPSMRVNGEPVAGAMEDPMLDLYDSSGSPTPFATNDNWEASSQRDEIAETGLAPGDEREAAIVAVLAPGAYTGIVSGANGSTGNAIVEVFALPGESNSSLVNISTRGPVLTADDLLIGGVIVRGGTPQRLVFRAIGPDLANRGVADALENPRLELRDTNGDLIVANDNWQESPERDEIDAVNLEPNDPREAAIVRSLGAGDYTAIVRGEGGAVGIGMVEVYRLE